MNWVDKCRGREELTDDEVQFLSKREEGDFQLQFFKAVGSDFLLNVTGMTIKEGANILMEYERTGKVLTLAEFLEKRKAKS